MTMIMINAFFYTSRLINRISKGVLVFRSGALCILCYLHPIVTHLPIITLKELVVFMITHHIN